MSVPGPGRSWLLVALLACLLSQTRVAPAAATKETVKTSHVRQAVEAVEISVEAVAKVEQRGELTVIYLKEGEAGPPGLKVDAPVIVQPAFDEADPQGAFGKVLRPPKVLGDEKRIVLGEEGIEAAFDEFELKVKGEDIDQLEEEAQQEAAESTGEPGPLAPDPLDHLARLLHCTGKTEPRAELEVDLGNLEPELVMSLKRRVFRLRIRGTPTFSGHFGATGDAACEGTFLPKLSIPILHVPPVFLELGPVLGATLTGHIKTGFEWSPKVALGLERSGGEMVPIKEFLSAPPTIKEPTIEGSATADLGLSVGVSLAKTFAVAGRLGPSLKIEHSLTAEPPCTKETASGYAELTGTVNLFVRRWNVTLAREGFLARSFPKDVKCPS